MSPSRLTNSLLGKFKNLLSSDRPRSSFAESDTPDSLTLPVQKVSIIPPHLGWSTSLDPDVSKDDQDLVDPFLPYIPLAAQDEFWRLSVSKFNLSTSQHTLLPSPPSTLESPLETDEPCSPSTSHQSHSGCSSTQPRTPDSPTFFLSGPGLAPSPSGASTSSSCGSLSASPSSYQGVDDADADPFAKGRIQIVRRSDGYYTLPRSATTLLSSPDRGRKTQSLPKPSSLYRDNVNVNQSHTSSKPSRPAPRPPPLSAPPPGPLPSLPALTFPKTAPNTPTSAAFSPRHRGRKLSMTSQRYEVAPKTSTYSHGRLHTHPGYRGQTRSSGVRKNSLSGKVTIHSSLPRPTHQRKGSPYPLLAGIFANPAAGDSEAHNIHLSGLSKSASIPSFPDHDGSSDSDFFTSGPETEFSRRLAEYSRSKMLSETEKAAGTFPTSDVLQC